MVHVCILQHAGYKKFGFICSQGRYECLYMFFRKHLKWDMLQYTRYTTILGVFGLLGQYVAVPTLSKKFQLHDTTISLIDAATRYSTYNTYP